MKRTVLLGLLVAVLVLVVGYLALVPNATGIFSAKKTITDPAQISKLTLGFVQNPYPDDYQVMRIPGWVANYGTKTIAKADIEIQLLDADGNRKELVKYTLTNIAPKSRKTFDANAGNFSGPRTSKIRIVKLEVEN